MQNPANILRAALEAGTVLEDGLAELRMLGATPVETIMAIREVQGVGLATAKQVFCASPAWATEVRAGDALHEELIALGKKGSHDASGQAL